MSIQFLTTGTIAPPPCEIWFVELPDNSVIKFDTPLILQPRILDKGTSAQCYCIENEKLALFAVAPNLDELLSCVKSDIRMTWQHVVQKPDNELTPADQLVKKQFRQIATVEQHG